MPRLREEARSRSFDGASRRLSPKAARRSPAASRMRCERARHEHGGATAGLVDSSGPLLVSSGPFIAHVPSKARDKIYLEAAT